MTINDQLEILRKYRSLAEVPRDVLEGLSLAIVAGDNGVLQLMPKSTLDERAACAFPILKAYSGYLFPADHQHVKDVYRGVCKPDQIRMQAAVRRAARIKQAGLPPIYDYQNNRLSSGALRVTEDGSGQLYSQQDDCFPKEDFIILYGSGVYEQRRTAQALKAKSLLGKVKVDHPDFKLAIEPCHVQDVQMFCATAFTDEEGISTRLIRDLQYHIHRNFRFKRDEHRLSVLAEVKRVAEHLEKVLLPFSGVNRVFQDWDGDISVVNAKRWYLNYTVAEQDRIAKTYFDSLPDRPQDSERVVYLRMCATFPEFAPCGDELMMRGLEERIVHSIQTNNFFHLPRKMFQADVKDKRVYNAALHYFSQFCQDCVDREDTKILVNVNELFHELRLPAQTPKLPEFREILDLARLLLLEKIPDEAFEDHFRHGGPRFTVGDFGRGMADDELGSELRQHVLVRSQRLDCR